MRSKHHKIKVGISVGDFNGIGPEIIMKSLKEKNITDFFTPIIFASGKLFAYQKNVFKLQHLNFNYINGAKDAHAGKINMINLTRENCNISFGTPTEESTKMAIASLESATEALINKEIDVLVTAPINKDEMKKYGFSHTGHTNFFEEKLNKKALMFMISENLKVAVSTHHIPVSDIVKNISKDKIKVQICQLITTLKEDFCIEKPKIAVLGLNPHAGDRGIIGTEEINIIEPAIKELYNDGFLVFGPYSADSFFRPEKYFTFDAILAMYHDQGLVPFKTLVYEEGVNYSAGLPFIRTSPDHGTAYDIAGKNLADEKSFSEAIFAAIEIYKNRKEYHELVENQLCPKTVHSANAIDEDLPEER